MQQPDHYHVSWDELHRDTRQLASLLIDQPWQGIIGIARGGLIPAAIVARELNIRLVDTLCIASYDETNQRELEVLKSVSGSGRNLLLIDDLVDSGNTARKARELLPEATFACLYAKPDGARYADHVVRNFSQQTWIHFPWDGRLSYATPMIDAVSKN